MKTFEQFLNEFKVKSKKIKLIEDPSLIIDVNNNDIEVVREKLKNNVNPDSIDSMGYTALWYGRCTPEIAELLLRYGADVNYLGGSQQNVYPLANASYFGRDELCKVLVEYGANVNVFAAKQETPLHFACAHGELDLIKLYVKKGADINVKNTQGQTPLMFCFLNDINKGKKSAKLLLELGADKTLLDRRGKSAYNYARGKSNDYKILDLLEYKEMFK